MNSFRFKAILMLVIFLFVSPSTLARDISTVKSEPTEDVKEIIHHKGDLIVEGGETYVIEKVTFFIDGNIFVEDNSTLLIKNSEIILESRFFTHYNVYLKGNAKFIAENSTLESLGHHAVMFKVGDGTLMLRNTEYEWQIHAGGKIVIKNCKSPRAPIFFQGGEIYISDSEVHAICIPVNSEEESVFELDNLHPGFNKHVIIKRSHGNKLLELTNTFVSRWVVDVGSGTRLTYENLVVKNSVLSGLWFWFHMDSYVEISDLELGYFPHWKMREEWNLEGVTYNVELINTTITDLYKLQIYGQAQIENVSGSQVAPRGSAFVYVRDSTIEPNLILRGNEYVILEDTEIQVLHLEEDRSIRPTQGGIHHLEFRGGKITGSIEIASNYTLIKGEVVFYTRFEDINWAFGIVEREFPVIVEFKGNTYPNASLNLVDSSGNLIWKGKTDGNGVALFNLTFMKGNYTEKYRLLTKSQNRTISRKISFLSDTPVVFSFDKFSTDGDLGDWKAIPPLATDESGDSLVEYGDLRAIYATLDENHLYIAVETYDGGIEKTAENLIIEIDSDLDGKRDYVIDLHYVRNEETHEESQIVESAVDRVIELRVPLESIGNPDEFNIGAHIIYEISESEHAASDEMEGWTLISRRSSISTDMSSNQILHGENLTVSGEISPSKIGAPITLTYQMPNGSLLTRNVTSTDIGAFNFTFRPDVIGSWSVKASWEGDLTHNGASSQTTSFTVVEPEQTTDEEPKSGGILSLSYEPIILSLVFGAIIILFLHRARKA